MMFRPAAFVVAAALLLGAMARPLVEARAGVPSTKAMLDAYARHQFNVIAPVATITATDIDRFARSFRTDTDKWILAAGPTREAERRRIAVTMALDIVRIWAPASAGRLRGPQLIAWSCRQLESAAGTGVPDAFERDWQLAAVSLLEGVDPAMEMGGTTISEDATGGFPELVRELGEGHLRHARDRFPGEPRFVLASVVAQENRAWQAGAFDVPIVDRGQIIPGELTKAYIEAVAAVAAQASTITVSIRARNAVAEAARIRLLGAQLAPLEGLARSAAVAGEVHLHYGFLAARFGERAVALDHFRQVETATSDVALRYLARLFSGVTRERLQQFPEAETAYRAALELAPRAQAASVLLGSLLLRHGRLNDASAQADVFFGAPPTPDPWPTYRTGDFRLAGDYLARLRAALP